MRRAGGSSIRSELRKIQRSFHNLARAFQRLGPAFATGRSTTNTTAAATPSGRRRPKLTTAQRRALKLQGRYMGTMRGLTARNQARVKAVRKAKGIHAAIKEAQKLSAR